ncbi:hypothetical protein FOA52_011410 [Chlamydomonas sp. UWO 241]|nr:hypothetical protein FOA52_011410 [Chlamydomonas sp. UWO 241]
MDPAPVAADGSSASHGEGGSGSDGNMQALLASAESFVRTALANHDGSHDFWHVARVRANAASLARSEKLPQSRAQLVELAALLHDVGDWKYTGQPGIQKHSVEDFLRSQNCEEGLILEVAHIIECVGFKDELGGGGGAHVEAMSLEARIVQDADRLDAIGAIGIARCFTFGGAFKRPLHDPSVPPRVGLTKEQYTKGAGGSENTTLNHFHEKLLLLSALMKTEAGRATAAMRHAYMKGFLQQFGDEWEGRACHVESLESLAAENMMLSTRTASASAASVRPTASTAGRSVSVSARRSVAVSALPSFPWAKKIEEEEEDDDEPTGFRFPSFGSKAKAAPVKAVKRSPPPAPKKSFSLPFFSKEEEDEEEKPRFSFPSFSKSETSSKPAKVAAKPVKAKTVMKVAAPKAKQVVAAAPKPKPSGNPFSTVERNRPLGSLGHEEEFDIGVIKPSPWERWGKGL